MVRTKYCGVIACAFTTANCNVKPCDGTFTIFTMLLLRNIDVMYITCELLYVDTYLYIRSLTIDYYNNSVVSRFYLSGLLRQPQTTAFINEYHNT